MKYDTGTQVLCKLNIPCNALYCVKLMLLRIVAKLKRSQLYFDQETKAALSFLLLLKILLFIEQLSLG